MADVDDQDVSALISQMQSTLDKLKAAQDKDDSDEDSLPGGNKDNRADSEQPPQSLKEAGARHQRMLAAQKK